MLRDVNESNLLFGGKVVVFGEDFCLVLLILHMGTRKQQINASLVSSYVWSSLTNIRLTANMRTRLDLNFSYLLLQLDGGE